MKSIWKEPDHDKHTTELKEDIQRETVIVGGGIAGFLTAYRLTEKGRKVTLIDADVLFSGVTRYTTAHISALQGIKYSELKNKETAALYYESQLSAINEFEVLVKKYNIDCDFQRLDSYLYTDTDKARLKKEYDALKAIGSKAEYLENAELPTGVAGAAIVLSHQAAFAPIKFLSGLPVGFEVFERTRIIKVDYKKKVLYTEKFHIKAQKIIIATNFPIIDIPGWYFLRMYKSSSYAAALTDAKDIKGLYQDDNENGYTYRNYDGNTIIGGLDHRTGRLDNLDKYTQLKANAEAKLLGGETTHCWSANDCLTFDTLPFIGYYSGCSKDFYVISGFNKWGMANSMAGSILLCDMICGNDNKYRELFSPQRRLPFNCAFLKNALCVVKNLIIKPLLPACKSYKSLGKDEGGIVMYKYRKMAVYRDKNGDLHVCQPLCAHLKCQLKFNAADKTWDCPCHGSRFDIDGNIIFGPTVKNLEKHEII